MGVPEAHDQLRSPPVKATEQCYPCLARLARQAGDLSSADPAVAGRAADAALRVLDREFSLDRVTIVIAGAMHQAVKEASGTPDPYRAMKEREATIARAAFPTARRRCRDSLPDLLRLAALGNVLDFFREPAVIMRDLETAPKFVIDHSAAFASNLPAARTVLYLADNAGELLFDMPLLNLLRRTARVIYAVKPAPVQDDITLDEVGSAGLVEEAGETMTTGAATPGVDWAAASPEFRAAFAGADLVFAKGMGYWESLSELPAEGKVLHCLMAKCQPVADSLGVPLGSFVALLR